MNTASLRELSVHETEQVAGGKPPPPPPWLGIGWLIGGIVTPSLPSLPIFVPGGP